jgi:hypothetical protein
MYTRHTALTTLLVLVAQGAHAAAPSIGFVMARGSFYLDSSRIWNNGTAFEGSTVETKTVPSRIHLGNGSEVQIAADSRVRIFKTRVVLEKGAVRLQSSTAFQVDAQSLHIASGAENTEAGVELRKAGGVGVSTKVGQVAITNGDGVLVANVASGRTVTLSPDPGGGAGMTKVTGCLLSVKRAVTLTDEVSGLTFQVRGEQLDAAVGGRVEIVGAADRLSKASGGLPVIHVVHMTPLNTGVCALAAVPSKQSRPIGKIAPVAIIGGVVVAAAVGGLAAEGAFSSNLEEVPPATSRLE